MKSTHASASPTPIATTRSNTTVNINVTKRTIVSLLGEVFTRWAKVLQPLILYATMKRIAAMAGIGISFARGISETSISKSTAA